MHVVPRQFAQAQGRAVEEYVQEHQDRSRNALHKSLLAAFSSWQEDLKADEAQFMAEKLVCPGVASFENFHSTRFRVSHFATAHCFQQIVLVCCGVV